MASFPPSSFLFLLPILLLCFSPAFSAPSKSNPYIEKICNQTEDYGFCNKTFCHNLVSPSTADLRALGNVAVEQSFINARNTRALILDLLPRTTVGSEKKALTACDNGYKVLFNLFQLAMGEIYGGDYRNLVENLKKTHPALESCSSSFSAPPYPENPVADQNRKMKILIDISTVTADYLIKM